MTTDMLLEKTPSARQRQFPPPANIVTLEEYFAIDSRERTQD